MTDADFRTAPIDPESAERLAAQGLDFRLLETTDAEATRSWQRAVAWGFLGEEPEEAELDRGAEALAYRRRSAVYDAGAADPRHPVATIDSWRSELTLPGGALLPSWAISGVTVAPTHAGRGIARAMLEAELRTAVALGLPMAMLTVSDSRLYGRYGFAPATFATDWTIDTRRARWAGPETVGRVDAVTPARWREEVEGLHDRVRRVRPGEVPLWPRRFDQMVGLVGDGAAARKKRALQYRDPHGVVRGLAVYDLGDEPEDDFLAHELRVGYLLAETPDAHAALWRTLLGHPAVASIRADCLSVEDPLLWYLDDMRAARVLVWEHQYLRVLDPAAALAARGVSDATVFTDPLGIAGPRPGTDGGGAADAGPDVRDLASAYLGAPGTRRLPAALAEALRTTEQPYLGAWY